MKWLSYVFFIIALVKLIDCRLIENRFEKSFQLDKNSIENRIVGGDLAPAGRFTYQAAINTDIGLFCNGALISDKFILTAAHCVDGIFYLFAYLGVDNIRNRTEDWVQQTVYRDSWHLHPEYNAAEVRNDIAILEIPEPIQFNVVITSIGLPYKHERNSDYSGKYVTVTGWGQDSDDAAGLTSRLHYAHLKLLPHEVCRHFYFDRVQKTNLCTDTGMGQAICYGDSGAPIVFRRKDGSSSLIGLASFISPIGCASGWPSVFTRVDSYLDWIESVTGIKMDE